MILINLVMLILSWTVAFFSLRAYARASFNKIDSLYWGVSFLLVGINFFVYSLLEIFPPINLTLHAYTCHFIDSYVWLIQVSIAVRLRQAFNDRSNRTIRITRIISEVVKVILLSAFLTTSLYNLSFFNADYMNNIQLLGNRRLDFLVEGIHAFIAFSIMILVPSLSYYNFVKIGAGLVGVSEVLQIVNIYLYQYQNIHFLNAEWITAILGVFAMLLGVLSINKETHIHEKRKEQRVEETSIPHVKKLIEQKGEE